MNLKESKEVSVRRFGEKRKKEENTQLYDNFKKEIKKKSKNLQRES